MNTRRRCAALVLALLASLVGVASQAGAVGYPQPGVVSADPVNSTPHALNGTVLAIATVGSRVYVGGTFTTVTDAGSSVQLRRPYLFAFRRDTGRVVSDFTPTLNGSVESIAAAPGGSSIIVGGKFRSVNGTTQRGLAMLDARGTRVSGFVGRTDGDVSKVLVRGNRLIVGGRFGLVNDVRRSNLAVLDATSGQLDRGFALGVSQGRVLNDGTVTGASVLEMDADAAGTKLVVVGNFRKVGTETRQQIAMFDLQGGGLSSWSTDRFPNDVTGSSQAFRCYQVFYTQMRDVEFSPDGSYFVVATTGGAPDRNVGNLCDTATRWETTPNGPGPAVETWRNCTGGDTLLSVAATGSAVYVGGHQRWLDNCGGVDSAVPGSFAAPGIGAIDPSTGRAIRTWNPGRDRGVGAEELVADPDGLYVGSDTTTLGGEYHARLGLFPRS